MTGLFHSRPQRGYQLNADDVSALHNDPAYAEAIITYRGDGPLFGHVLNSLFADERRADATNPPSQREDDLEPRGRYARRRYAS